MDLRYSEEQQLIAQQARAFCEKECPLETVRAAWRREADLPEALWRRMAELGWLGALIPERYGGQGLTHTDLSRILEEMGRGLLPGPYLAHLFGGAALLLAGDEAQKKALLPPVARGELRVALARSLEGGRFDEMGGRFYADEESEGYLLFGEKLGVPGLLQAQRIVVAAVLGLPERLNEGMAFFLVEPGAPGVEIHPLDTLEGGLKQGSLRLTGVRVPREGRLQGASGLGPLTRLSALVDLALAFDALGGAQRVTELAVDYARLRTAFGQPIGAFQAIKHKCADMLFAVENLRALATWAAWVMDVPEAESGVSAALATAMARLTAIEGYDLVIRHGTQVHGAIAVTEEHDLQLYAKRCKTLALAFGGLAHYQETILQASGFAPTVEGASLPPGP
jgi:alkylation response protein AidB-like acyl-CoA dehydrogenase